MRLYPSLTVDGEFKALRDAGYTGSLNDMQFAFLRSEGYSGALGDMQYQFTGGDAPDPGPGSEYTWTMTAGTQGSVSFPGYQDGNADGTADRGSISNQPIEGITLAQQLTRASNPATTENRNRLSFGGDVRSQLPDPATLTVNGSQWSISGLDLDIATGRTFYSVWSPSTPPIYVNGTTYNCSIS